MKNGLSVLKKIVLELRGVSKAKRAQAGIEELCEPRFAIRDLRFAIRDMPYAITA